jgi:hypothetical protein
MNKCSLVVKTIPQSFGITLANKLYFAVLRVNFVASRAARR